MRLLFPCFLVLFLFNTNAFSKNTQLIIWNVGQGSWSTVTSKQYCLHFDIGGEFAPLNKIKNICSQKKNIAFYSHWDWDHINLSKQALKHLPNLCIEKLPNGPLLNTKSLKRKKGFLKKIPFCQKSNNQNIKELNFSHRFNKKRSANSYSRIFIWNKNVLFPGDSTKKDEALWAPLLNSYNKIHYLIVGHHGSLTSTSKKLLLHLPNLKMAAVSARYRRYKHPHPKVLQRLKNKKVPVIDTETWGNLIFEL